MLSIGVASDDRNASRMSASARTISRNSSTPGAMSVADVGMRLCATSLMCEIAVSMWRLASVSRRAGASLLATMCSVPDGSIFTSFVSGPGACPLKSAVVAAGRTRLDAR